jgi:hypothetical protein
MQTTPQLYNQSMFDRQCTYFTNESKLMHPIVIWQMEEVQAQVNCPKNLHCLSVHWRGEGKFTKFSNPCQCAHLTSRKLIDTHEMSDSEESSTALESTSRIRSSSESSEERISVDTSQMSQAVRLGITNRQQREWITHRSGNDGPNFIRGGYGESSSRSGSSITESIRRSLNSLRDYYFTDYRRDKSGRNKRDWDPQYERTRRWVHNGVQGGSHLGVERRRQNRYPKQHRERQLHTAGRLAPADNVQIQNHSEGSYRIMQGNEKPRNQSRDDRAETRTSASHIGQRRNRFPPTAHNNNLDLIHLHHQRLPQVPRAEQRSRHVSFEDLPDEELRENTTSYNALRSHNNPPKTWRSNSSSSTHVHDHENEGTNRRHRSARPFSHRPSSHVEQITSGARSRVGTSITPRRQTGRIIDI